MSEFIGPAERCTMCDSEALDPTDAYPLCEEHTELLHTSQQEAGQ